MTIKKKLKKVNKPFLVVYLLLGICLLTSIILLTINLSYLSGIETLYRILIAVIFYLFLIFYLLYCFVWLFSKKYIKLLIFSFFAIVMIAISLLASYYINKTYRIIDTINKDTILYTTNLVVLKEYDFKNENTEKIAMISDENDITGNILAKELINQEKLNNIEIVLFDDYYEMFDSLEQKDIQGLFVSSNYESLFVEEELYSSIASETKVVKSYSKKLPKKDLSSSKKLTEPFTLLLLGIDSTIDGLNKNAAFNGDSIMLITFNPNTLSTTFLSIPRDTFVPIACRKNQEAKINSSSYSGVSCMMDTITNFTGIEIDYYVKMNFTGIVDLVDALGGINVEVPYSLCEQNSKRKWGKDTVFVEEGKQKLNGEQALALARNRHYPNDKGAGEMKIQCPTYNKGIRNDFVRGQNQQLVVQAIINQTKSIRNIDSFYKILSSISNNMDTNIETNQMLSFYEVVKQLLVGVMQGRENLLKADKLYLQTSNLMIYKIGSAEIYQRKSLDEVVKAMKINLGLLLQDSIKNFSFDANVPYEIPIIGKGLYDNFKRQTLPNFTNQTKDYVINWAKANNITITTKEIDATNPLYNPELANNTVIAQSVPANTLMENVNKLEITVQLVQ